MEVSVQLPAAAVIPQGKNHGTHWTGGWMDTRARLEISRREDIRAPAGILIPNGLARSLTELPWLLSTFNNQNYIRRRIISGSFCSYNRQALEYTHITESATKKCYKEIWKCAQFHGKFITTCHEIAYGNSTNAETYRGLHWFTELCIRHKVMFYTYSERNNLSDYGNRTDCDCT